MSAPQRNIRRLAAITPELIAATAGAMIIMVLLVGIWAANSMSPRWPEPQEPGVESDPRWQTDLPDAEVARLLAMVQEYANATQARVFFTDEPDSPIQPTSDEAYHLVAHLRRQLRFQSIEDRLSRYRLDAVGPSVALSDDVQEEIGRDHNWYRSIAVGGRSVPMSRRSYALHLLHDRTVQDFITSQGFGVERMVDEYDWHPLAEADTCPEPFDPGPELDETLVGPAVDFPPEPDSMGYVEPRDSYDDQLAHYISTNATTNPHLMLPLEELELLHRRSDSAFGDNENWGYVRSTAEVAGFVPHRLLGVPKFEPWDRLWAQAWASDGPQAVWRMNRLQLVSILKNPSRPVAYITQGLPDMQDAADAPTRAHEPWELESLQKLVEGEELIVESRLNRVRMLGALRASNGCLQCHTASRGDLLGAFSYQIVRREPLKIE